MKPKDSARQPILPFDASAAPDPSPDAPKRPDGGVASSHTRTAPSKPPRPPNRIESFLPEALVLLAAVVVLGVGLSAVPLLDPDEARYASASRAMLERGDLVVPYFNGAERLNKPALFYWLQAASFHLFGTTAAAARIPSALAALGILAAVTLFARRTFGAEAGWRSGLILLTIPLFAVVGKTGITDMTLALFTVGAMLFWYRLNIGDNGETPASPASAGATTDVRRRLLWLGVSLCLGLAFFVKGPVGILVPCFVIATYLVIRREWSGFRVRGILLGGAVALAVFLPWAGMLVYRLGNEAAGAGARDVAGAVAADTGADEGTGTSAGEGTGTSTDSSSEESSSTGKGPSAAGVGAGLSPVLLAGVGRVSELLRRETIDRTLHGLDHPEPPYYYWLASLIIFFPWIAWTPPVIVRTWPRLRRLEPATLFLVTWLIGILVFFTAIRGKLVTYVLPAAPAIA